MLNMIWLDVCSCSVWRGQLLSPNWFFHRDVRCLFEVGISMVIHVCAGQFTRPCIVHTEFWRIVYHRQPIPKTDCQLSRRFIWDYLGLQRVFWWPVQFFPRGLSNMVPLWQRIDICSPVVFIPTMWLKKTFHSVFFFKFEIVRQINAFGKPDLFF